MIKYEFKKFPILAIVLSLITIIAGVFTLSFNLINRIYDGNGALALLEIVAGVLIFAGLTIGRPLMLRVISIIITVSLLVVNFVLTIVKYDAGDSYLFATGLLMLIASVLALVYFLASKNERIRKMYIITGITLTCLAALYIIIYIVKDVIAFTSVENGVLHISYYPLIVGFITITALPVAVFTATERIDVKKQPKVEQPVEEPKAEEPQPEVIEPEQEVVEDK